jgi:GT2 family glycosyltransferase
MKNNNDYSKTAAIVVSYNRKELLKRCIEKLQNQTYPLEKILIVDNGSDKEVINSLESLKNSDKKIELLLQENLGGAGGFHNGMRHVVDNFPEIQYLWLMDDDGYPTENALSQIMEQVKVSNLKNGAVFNSLVVEDEKTLALSFPFDNEFFNNRLSSQVCYWGTANFFNGTLIPTTLIAKLGFPIKKLFIKGDEAEYFARIKKKGIPICTVLNSIFIHPPNWGGQSSEIAYENLWALYFSVRNRFYVEKHYYPSINAFKRITRIIHLLCYYKSWKRVKNRVTRINANQKEILNKLFYKVLMHVILNNYQWNVADAKKYINSLKYK